MATKEQWFEYTAQADHLFQRHNVQGFDLDQARSIIVQSQKICDENNDKLLDEWLTKTETTFKGMIQRQEASLEDGKSWKWNYRQLSKILASRYQIQPKGYWQGQYTKLGFSLGLLLGAFLGLVYLKSYSWVILGLLVGISLGYWLGKRKDQRQIEKGLAY